MNGPQKPIEEFFLVSVLKLSLAAVLIVTALDIFLTEVNQQRALIIDFSILFFIVISFVLYRIGHFQSAVLFAGLLVCTAMFFQVINATAMPSTSMAVVLLVGFMFSVSLKRKMPTPFHGIVLLGIVAVFAWIAFHPSQYGQTAPNDAISIGITYLILYGIIAYATLKLKQLYDKAFVDLAEKNKELSEKTNEIETQNEELMQSQENLHRLNEHLEAMVEERTHEIQRQNERLIKYAYSNAHHLRGPVARLLGLIYLTKLEGKPDYAVFFEKIEQQAHEIDDVVKTINSELDASE